MAASGTSFDIDIPVQSSQVEPAAAQLANLADRLTAASEASKAAAEGVKAGELAYKQAEIAADRAAKALEKINLAADAQREKMKAAMEAGDPAAFSRAAAAAEKLTQKQGEMAAKAASAKAALETEAASLDKLKAAAAHASAQEEQLGKAHDQAKKAADAQKKLQEAASGSGKVNEMAEAFGRLGGPVGALGQKAFGAADGLKKLFASMGTALGATAGVVLVVAAITGGLIAATAAILHFSIASSDAARTSRLLSDGIAGSVAGGAKLEAKIASLSKTVPQTRDELRSMAADLAKTGLKGEALSQALEDAAVKAATVKYGPDFAKQTLSLDNQTRRLHENIAGLFGGLKIEGLLEGLSKIIGLFDETSVTGKAIKVVFESIFQPLVDGLASLAPKIVAAFIQFEIWALKALIAVKPFGSTFLFIGKVLGVIALAVGVALGVVLGIIVAVAAASAALIAGLVYLGSVFFGLIAQAVSFGASLISGVGGAFDWLVSKVHEAIDFLSGLSLSAIGAALIQGLADGITGGGAAILSSITGVVGGAIDGARKLLGIASPSKVFAEIGANTAAGMAGGVEGGSGNVQGALESMVAPPDAGGGTANTSVSHGGNTFNIVVNAGGSGDAGSIGAAVRKAIEELLEGGSAQLGAEVPT